MECAALFYFAGFLFDMKQLLSLIGNDNEKKLINYLTITKFFQQIQNFFSRMIFQYLTRINLNDFRKRKIFIFILSKKKKSESILRIFSIVFLF